MNILDHVNVVMRIGETKTLITQTGSEISLKVDNIKGDYAELKVTIDGITSTVIKQGIAMSEINQKADSITMTVKDLQDITNQTFTQIQQTATKISAIVTSPDGGSSWELSKDACVTAIKNATGSHTCTFDSSGLSVENGGLYVKDSSGKVMLYFDDAGYGVMPELYAGDIRLDDPNNAQGFQSTMSNASFSCKEIKPSRLTIQAGQFYIGSGYTLDQYIEKVLSDHGLI